jgi:hypothetical protein
MEKSRKNEKNRKDTKTQNNECVLIRLGVGIEDRELYDML